MLIRGRGTRAAVAAAQNGRALVSNFAKHGSVAIQLKPTSQSGRTVIETEVEPTLDQMLAAFDPKKHAGEVMAGGAVGAEAFAHSDSTKNKAPHAVET